MSTCDTQGLVPISTESRRFSNYWAINLCWVLVALYLWLHLILLVVTSMIVTCHRRRNQDTDGVVTLQASQLNRVLTWGAVLLTLLGPRWRNSSRLQCVHGKCRVNFPGLRETGERKGGEWSQMTEFMGTEDLGERQGWWNSAWELSIILKAADQPGDL